MALWLRKISAVSALIVFCSSQAGLATEGNLKFRGGRLSNSHYDARHDRQPL